MHGSSACVNEFPLTDAFFFLKRFQLQVLSYTVLANGYDCPQVLIPRHSKCRHAQRFSRKPYIYELLSLNSCGQASKQFQAESHAQELASLGYHDWLAELKANQLESQN
jgi:hypothetical protein